MYRRPEEHSWITTEEFAVIKDDAGKVPSGPGFSRAELFRFPQTWGLLLARFFSDPVWWFYLFWMPKYLVEHRGFSMLEMGMLAWLPYLSADLGSVAAGLASGYLIKRNWGVLNARTAAMLPCAMVMPLSVVIAMTPSSAVALTLICVVTFAHMGWKTNLMTVTNDIYPTGVVGSISGVIAFGSGLGGTLFTNLTGHVVERFSYTWIFIIMGFLHPVAFLVFWMLVRRPIAPKVEKAVELV
jgi:ACS family hexuronate transporter-like MFS transporter